MQLKKRDAAFGIAQELLFGCTFRHTQKKCRRRAPAAKQVRDPALKAGMLVGEDWEPVVAMPPAQATIKRLQSTFS
jgi:hypothetical protein